MLCLKASCPIWETCIPMQQLVAPSVQAGSGILTRSLLRTKAHSAGQKLNITPSQSRLAMDDRLTVARFPASSRRASELCR